MMMVEQTQLRGSLRFDEPMARHTSWRVGGPAERYYEPADMEDLAAFLAQLPQGEPLMFVGLGSNLLVRDGGIRGTLIMLSGLLNNIELLDGQSVRVEAGVSCARVARFCARENLLGVEFLAGIPGTVGGALAMNAGAFGGEMWDHVIRVETIDRCGQRRTRERGDFQVAYRSVYGAKDEWFVAAHLQLKEGDSQAAMANIKRLLEKRNKTQPIGQPSCGSVFRNPPGDYAARLIEACGLKSFCIGAACVSEKHANFIVNTGGASAADIESMIDHVAQTVREKQGVELQREVHIVGEFLR